MSDELYDFEPDESWLTRGEAARYVGASGESTIRAAEGKGLRGTPDPNGQVWHTPTTLDAWSWRGERPSDAQRARVLRDARKARQNEARSRERRREQEWQRQQGAADAELAQVNATWAAEDAFKESVRRKANDQREAFRLAHMDITTVGEALGFKSYKAYDQAKDLVRRGLLREIECPREPSVMMTPSGLREVEGFIPLCHGGPFFQREEVLALRRELMEEATRDEPHPSAEAPPDQPKALPEEDPLVLFLRALVRLQR